MTDPRTVLPAGHGLMVLLPDAQLDGVAEGLAHRLASTQCEIKAVVARDLEPPLVARLYKSNLGRTDPDRMEGTWLSRHMFSLGRSVVLLLRSAVITDLPATLAAWKGPSAPADRNPGALRSVARYANKCMSILHTPDDSERAAEDAALLFGADLLDLLLTKPVDRAVSWQDVARVIEPIRPDVETSPGIFLNRLVAKAITELRLDARLMPWAPQGFSTNLVEALETGALQHGELRYPDLPQARVTPTTAYGAAVQRRLIARRRELVDVLALLGNGETGGLFAEHALQVLSDNGVVSDPWERHMLLTTVTFPPT